MLYHAGVTTGESIAQGGGFNLHTQVLDALPLVDHFCSRLALNEWLHTAVGGGDARTRLSPARALGVVIRNICLHHEPVYALGEWAARHDPSTLGLRPGDVELVNDDRVGRALGRLFDADRATLLNELVLRAVKEFEVDCSQLHNDSTSVRLNGVFAKASGRPRGGKPTVIAAHGFSKDHRPDLKQLVWILTVAADGAVPLAHRVTDGNTEDSTTHISTWEGLCQLLGQNDFLYVADSKLAVRTTMDHIHRHGGRFVTVLPRSRKEDQALREWLVSHEPEWAEVLRRPGRRQEDPDDVYSVAPAPWPSGEGYRVVWVLSSGKRERDAETRQRRIADGIAALDALNQRLLSPRTRLRDRVTIATEADQALADCFASRWVGYEIQEVTEVRLRQESRGRPGRNTRYRRINTTRHRLHFVVREDLVAADACSDGCWPLVTNDRKLPAADLLVACKHQPHLERRHHLLKGDQLVAPVFLRDPARIEGLMTCHFIALLLQALIELQIRREMARRDLPSLPLYPEDRSTLAPSAERIIQVFTGVARHRLTDAAGNLVQTFPPELTILQQQLLELLAVPSACYA